MAHEIFISYSSKNLELTRKLENVIEAQYGTGSVWWDDRLVSSGEYEVQIRNALSNARAIVVIWTRRRCNLAVSRQRQTRPFERGN